MKRIRPVVKYHGGKYFLCRWLIEQFPEHDAYVEPFGGAATVLLNKPKETFEIYNDLEYGIYNLYWVVQNQLHDFLKMIEDFDYCQESWLKMQEIMFTPDLFNKMGRLGQAMCVYATRRMSRGGCGKQFSISKTRFYNGIEMNEYSWITMIPELKIISDRINKVELLNEPALDVIKKYDKSNTLFYLDPPYPRHTRNSALNYIKEMTDKDHQDLIDVIKNCRGKVIISSYPNPLYDNMGWRVLDKKITKHSSQHLIKGKTTERIYLNF